MSQTLIKLILTYKYPILIPLAFVEGHIITIIAGFLTRLGYFNFIVAGLCIMSGNLIGDILLYCLGYHQGDRFAKPFKKLFKITDESIEKAKRAFHIYHSPILLISKVTNGFGLAMVILFTAGMSKIPFGRYLVLNALGEAIWTFSLLTIGFFFGHLYSEIDSVMGKVFVIAIAILGIGISFYAANRYFRKKVETL